MYHLRISQPAAMPSHQIPKGLSTQEEQSGRGRDAWCAIVACVPCGVSTSRETLPVCSVSTCAPHESPQPKDGRNTRKCFLLVP